MNKTQRLNIEIDPLLMTRLRLQVALENSSIKDVVTEALEKHLPTKFSVPKEMKVEFVTEKTKQK